MTSPLRQADEGLPVRALVLIVVISLVVGVTATMIAWWMTPSALLGRERGQPRRPIAGVEQRLLDEVPRSREVFSREDARIERYEWVEPEVARVPITRAVELTLRGCRAAGAGASAFSPALRPPCAEEGAP